MRLSRQERHTFIILLIFTFFNGFLISISQTQDIIAKKAFNAFDWHIALLTMIWPIANFFSIWWGRALENSKNITIYFIIAAIFGRLILILIFWSTSIFQFLMITGLMYSFSSLILPAQNSIIQTNIRTVNRGKIFGYLTSLATLLMMITTLASGFILERNESFFRPLYMVVGITGFFGVLALALCKTPTRIVSVPKKGKRMNMFSEPIKRTIEILKTDKDFAIFQRNFFIYGIGFIILLPVIPKYLVDNLGMGYFSSFLAKGVISQIGLLLLSPLIGKIFDKTHPTKFTATGFAIYGLFPLLLLISSFGKINLATVGVYVAYIFFGIGMAVIHMSWNISSIYFAKKQNSSMYQSVHVTLTGVRGLLTPILGYLVMLVLGVRAVFVVSFCCLFTAAILNYKHYLDLHEKEFNWQQYRSRFIWTLRQLYPFR